MATARVRFVGGTLVTLDPVGTVGPGTVVVEGDRIVAVNETDNAPADRTIDCTGCIVMPGLVQPHTHLCQTLFRGLADGRALLAWLQERIWPLEAAHDPQSLRVSALLGAAELLRAGTTAILDMGTVRHTDAVFEACRQVGLRATIGKAMMDTGAEVPPALRDTADAALAESLDLADRWHGQEVGRLRYAMAPRFVLSCSEPLLKDTVAAARARGLRLHTHASENPDELSAVQAITGRSNVAYLDHVGMTGPDVVLAHCIWLGDEEEALLAASGTSVAHCPSSNLKLASGFAPVPALLERGINVGIAADGAPCNNNLDPFVEMRLAALIHLPRFGPTALPAPTVVRMATMGGARALGLADEIGSLEPGKKADVIVVRADGLHVSPLQDPYSALVYALHGADVRDVFVDGIQRVDDGRVIGIEPDDLRAAARREAQRCVERALG